MKNSLFIDSAQKRAAGIRPYRWPAIRIGQEAERLAALPSFGGTILAVFSKSIYLSGRDGQVLWIAQKDLPMHRRCMTVPFSYYSLRPGQRFSISGSSLRIGEAMVIDLDRAEEWEPFVVTPQDAYPMATVNDRVGQLFSNFSRPYTDSGLGPAIPVISAFASGRDPETIRMNPLLTRAMPPILAITEACLNKDIVQAAQIGRDLIGLGPGLTPSGDDFMGGLLFVFSWLKRIFLKDFFWDEQSILDLIDWSSSRTHPISHAILSDLSSGHGPEPLHDILNFLLSGGDRNKMLLNIDRLCGVGHTSGSDLIAGLLTGMLMVRSVA